MIYLSIYVNLLSDQRVILSLVYFLDQPNIEIKHVAAYFVFITKLIFTFNVNQKLIEASYCDFIKN